MTQRRSDRDSSSPTPRPRNRSGASQQRTPGTRSSSGASARKKAPTGARPARRPTQNGRPAERRTRVGRFLRIVGILALLLVLAVGVTGCAVYASMSSQLPDPDLTKARGRDQTTVIYDRTGKVLTKLFAEENRQDVALDDMPQHLRQAVIATEDRRFYEHTGVDPIGITRALVTDIVRREKAQGGSTITQQYVKQAFVTSEKTLKRKLQEAILAQRVERRYTKDQILQNYLNTIYFGHGSYGVEAASRAYFGKGVKKLSIAQAAMIAGVIKSPGRFSPYLEPEAAKVRRDTVLAQMRAQGYISEAEYAEATESPVKVAGLKSRSTKAPYFVEWIKEQLVEDFGEHAVYRGGLRIHTTLDPRAQAAAEKAIGDALDRKGDPSAALVAIKPGTGEILAMVGGKDFKSQQFNVAVQGRRQPGSAFKPFVLATALEQGVCPEQTFKSGAVSLKVGDQTWNVTGAHGSSAKEMRLRPATEQSVNSVYAQLILKVGADKVVDSAESLGVRKGIDAVPAIALGGLRHGVSPLEMANAYATLAAGGKRAKPFAVSSVEDPDGGELFKAKPRTTQAISPSVAYLTTDILKGVVARGTGTAAQIGRPAAGKTGTTQEYRDAWFVGYTPDIATAVWVGYPDSQREMKSVHGRVVTGGSFPAEIWAKFMRAALAGVPEHSFKRPGGLSTIRVCAQTGAAATEFCPETISALVIAKFSPDKCKEHTTPLKVAVPKLVGLPKEDALAKLDALKLKAEVVERPVSGVAAGIVAQQSPAPGSKIKTGKVVRLVVASGGGSDSPPEASFTAPENPKAGKPAELDASTSLDDGTIATYYWEFGDGQTGQGKVVSHVWSTPGTYEITLWVTDNAGQQGSVTKAVTVR